MGFDTPVFLFLFLPLVLGLHCIVPRPARNGVLLLASLVFYGWGDLAAVPILLGSVAVNFGLGLTVERQRKAGGGSIVLAAAVAANLAFLVYYKYLKFAVTSLAGLGLADASRFDPSFWAGWTLPLGISFFTFGVVSYLVDIHRGTVAAARNPLDFALYVALFPKITAGPIVRYADVASALRDRRPSLEGFAAGGRRFALGLGKKVLIANVAARVADEAFKMAGPDAATAWLGLACYTVQIYFDFSGYSDMAIGLGRMLGFSFRENFDHPYVSQSIQEFWRRWHISLSSWFRDYLYIPLGGGRVAPWRVYANLVVVFLLCGLWHGASWSFVAWGVYHGLFLVLERLGLGRLLAAAWRPLRHAYALLAVMVGWVFFRADDLGHAVRYLKAMFVPDAGLAGGSFPWFRMTFVGSEILLVLAVGLLGSMPLLPWAAERMAGAPDRPARPGAAALPALGVLLPLAVFVLAVMQLAVSTFSPFIYAKF